VRVNSIKYQFRTLKVRQVLSEQRTRVFKQITPYPCQVQGDHDGLFPPPLPVSRFDSERRGHDSITHIARHALVVLAHQLNRLFRGDIFARPANQQFIRFWLQSDFLSYAEFDSFCGVGLLTHPAGRWPAPSR